VFFELHVANNLGAERAGGVGEGRATESRMKLFSDGGTADLWAAFENERPESGFRQIESSHEAVVTPADDEDGILHAGLVSNCRFLDCEDRS
jgi:hypothetical protein